MSTFIQLHLLTSYPPSNLNRDDLGRPKQAVMGGSNRLRISSQSLKRAWRQSEIFENAVAGHKGVRTKEMGRKILTRMVEAGLNEKKAFQFSKELAGCFGKNKAKDKNDPHNELDVEQLVHFSPEEIADIEKLCDKLASTGEAPTEKDLKILRKEHQAADIALFGRMVAKFPVYNMEAAAQVAHAITVHKVAVEDDFFTAVDDLNKGTEDAGAGHMGETEFAAGLFYLYVCINRDLLYENLQGNSELAVKTIAGLVESAALVSPGGKQNSFGSRARASYILAEKGEYQPRSLAVSFLKPVEGNDMLNEAIRLLTETRENMDKVYGSCADSRMELNAATGTGNVGQIIAFASEG